jgi:energy-coupling factor transporter ATP-binding protein EcfA2
MNQETTQKMLDANSLFGKHFLNGRSLYLYSFNTLPSVNYTSGINGEKAYTAFKEKYSHMITNEHRFRNYDRKRKTYEFDETFFIMNNNCLVEFNVGYFEVLHDNTCPDLVREWMELASRFKVRQRRKPLEINLVIQTSYGLDLKSMEIKRTRLDLDLFYEDDFKEVDEVIRKRLNNKNDKGIILLHGAPGTGKTTYLRHLVGRIKKRVLFLSTSMAGNLMDPEFLELLIDNPETVLIIEDAETLLMDRKLSGNPGVSNLLNISDGLLADFLNVQLICTFNSPLTLVDAALLRKGRLIARYEFKKLGIAKAQRLSHHLGVQRIIDRPMTIAEISNQNEVQDVSKQMEVIGFRTEYMKN